MPVPQEQIVSIALGRAADVSVLHRAVAADPDVQTLVLRWTNEMHTRFGAQIEQVEHCVQLLGAQATALLVVAAQPLRAMISLSDEPATPWLALEAASMAIAAKSIAEADQRFDSDVAALAGLIKGLRLGLAILSHPEAQLEWYRDVRVHHGQSRMLALQCLMNHELREGQAPRPTPTSDIGPWLGAAPILHSAELLVHALACADAPAALNGWFKAIALPRRGAMALTEEVLLRGPRLARALGLPSKTWPSLPVLIGTEQGAPSLSELPVFQDHVIAHLRAALFRARAERSHQQRVDRVTGLTDMTGFIDVLRQGTLAWQSILGLHLPDVDAIFAIEGVDAADRLMRDAANVLGEVYGTACPMTRADRSTFLVATTMSGREAKVQAERGRGALRRIYRFQQSGARPLHAIASSASKKESFVEDSPEQVIARVMTALAQHPISGRRRVS